MDGFKARLRHSVRLRLSFWLATAIVGIAVVAGTASYLSALGEADELQDDTLRQVAALISQQPDLSRLPTTVAGGEAEPESQLIVQLLPAPHQLGPASSAMFLPSTLADGLQTIAEGKTAYRVLVKTLANDRRLTVAQRLDVRDEVARNAALRAVLPMVALIPVLLAVVALLVRRTFKPVIQLADDVHSQTERVLHPLSCKDVPSEVLPFVESVNRLLNRVQKSMDSERRFIADAAHELRSFMAALSLQAEGLSSTDMPIEARERVSALRHAIGRGRKLLEQLLDFARARNAAQASPEQLSMNQIFRQVLADLLPLAEARGIDVGVDSSQDLELVGCEADLLSIVRNLVDNAVRYTPAGSRVDLRARTCGHQVILEVEDNGMGVPASERERIVDPFYRVLGTDESGSGLGLSIVKAVVERLGGRLDLLDAHASTRGLLVRVWLPQRS